MKLSKIEKRMSTRGSITIIESLVGAFLVGGAVVLYFKLSLFAHGVTLANKELLEEAAIMQTIRDSIDCCATMGIEATTPLPVVCAQPSPLPGNGNIGTHIEDKMGTRLGSNVGSWTVNGGERFQIKDSSGTPLGTQIGSREIDASCQVNASSTPTNPRAELIVYRQRVSPLFLAGSATTRKDLFLRLTNLCSKCFMEGVDHVTCCGY